MFRAADVRRARDMRGRECDKMITSTLVGACLAVVFIFYLTRAAFFPLIASVSGNTLVVLSRLPFSRLSIIHEQSQILELPIRLLGTTVVVHDLLREGVESKVIVRARFLWWTAEANITTLDTDQDGNTLCVTHSTWCRTGDARLLQ